MPTSFNGQMLLTPSLAKSFPEQVVFVTTQYGVNEASIELTLTAPGLTEDKLDALRTELCEHLKKALVIDPDWVCIVEEETDVVNLGAQTVPDRQIAIRINDPQLMGDESEQEVLNAVRTFVKLRAKRVWQKAVVLTGRQLLVPLDFVVPEFLESSLTVSLPQELQLAGPYGRKVGTDDLEKFDRACDEFKRILTAMLSARGHTWRHLNVHGSREGVKIEILFDGARPPKPFQLNDIEEIICIVLRVYARYSSVRDQLVFEPVRRHHPDPYADADPPEQYEEY